MYKVINIGILKYLTDLISKREIGYNIRNKNKSFFNCKTKIFKNSFFPYAIDAWYSLDPSIINSDSLEVFKSKLLAFIRPVQISIYNVFNTKVLNSITLGIESLKVGLSPSKKNCVICLIESPLKMIKNAFCFILKAVFVLQIFMFLSRLFGYAGKTA